jgi:hypothetical protein
VWRPHEYTTWGKPGIYGWEIRVWVADMDGDGDLDIFVSQNGPGTNNAWLIFENVDGKGRFEKREIYRGYGAHETLFADFDGDGDIDILTAR